MTALSADRSGAYDQIRGTVLGTERVAIGTGATVYKGSVVFRKSTTGRAHAAGVSTSPTPALGRVTGFYSDANGINETSGVGDTSGTVYAEVQYGMELLVNVRTAIQTNAALLTTVVMSDDQTVGGTAIGTNTGLNQVLGGTLMAFEASDKSTGWLRVGAIDSPRGKITI